jgi:hypothetical protein
MHHAQICYEHFSRSGKRVPLFVPKSGDVYTRDPNSCNKTVAIVFIHMGSEFFNGGRQ